MRISLLVTLDPKYIPQLKVLLTSIYVNHPRQGFDIYLLHSRIPKDILVINPLYELWNTNIDNYLFAAASHTGKTEVANNVNKIRLGTNTNYYNSGVLLINLKLAREQIFSEDVFRFVEENSMELLLPDQDVLNALYGSKILRNIEK